MTREHIQNISIIKDAEVVAISDIHRQSIIKCKKILKKQVLFFKSHKELIKKNIADVYLISTPNFTHLKILKDVLKTKKHILIEKPPGKNSDETQQLLDAAVANDVYCMVGFQRRHTAITREAMRLVNENGPVSTVVTTFNKQILGGDGEELTTTLWNDIVHIVDLTRFMAGGEPVEVTAYQDKFAGDSYNHYSALIRFDNNVTGIIMGNRASGGRVIRSELHGPGIGCYMKIPEEIEILEDNQSRVMGGWEIDGVDKEDVPRYEGVLNMHEHFVDCIKTKKVPISDIRDVIHTVHLIDQIEAE